MIARLRRHRWFAAVLLAASPAVAGQVLPVLHPCPVDMPWVAGHGVAASMAGMSHHAGHPPAHQLAHHECSCIGQCSTPAIAAPPQGVVAAVALDAPRHLRWRVIEASDHRSSLVDRLPEKTAPPEA